MLSLQLLNSKGSGEFVRMLLRAAERFPPRDHTKLKTEIRPKHTRNVYKFHMDRNAFDPGFEFERAADRFSPPGSYKLSN